MLINPISMNIVNLTITSHNGIVNFMILKGIRETKVTAQTLMDLEWVQGWELSPKVKVLLLVRDHQRQPVHRCI